MHLNTALLILLPLIGLLRLVEIKLGDKNAAQMLANGGKEFAQYQRWPIFALYTAWLAALLFRTPAQEEISWPFLGLFLVLQFLRGWAIYHLGKYWTTRVIVVPLSTRIRTGPYRFFSHPIYIALAGEVLALSLAFGQWAVGCFFTGLTALWIFYRVRAENRALSQLLG
jgi:methyltransferase